MSLNESARQSHSLHPPDAVQGFGCSQQAFCNANGVCIDRHIACRCRRCIYVCPACNNYEASQCASQIWKLFSNQDRPFSSSTWSGRLFFLRKFSHLQSQQAGIQHKNALVPHLNGRWISKFSWKNSFLKNRRWFIQYHTKPELLLPVLKAKSGSITS